MWERYNYNHGAATSFLLERSSLSQRVPYQRFHCIMRKFVVTCTCYLFSGYEATPYELLQMPQSTVSSQRSSQTTPPPPSSPRPLQLGRLTRDLYQLHSSSTHSLSTVSADSKHELARRSSLEPASTKSLHDLNNLDDTDLDSYTTPSISITNRGKGSFCELFLPPPIMPLPQIKTKRSSTRSVKSRENASRTPSPSVSQTLRSGSRSSIVKSSSSLVGESHASDSRHSIREEEEGGGEGGGGGVSPQSKVATKLLQKRAKFCSPGMYHPSTVYCYCLLHFRQTTAFTSV